VRAWSFGGPQKKFPNGGEKTKSTMQRPDVVAHTVWLRPVGRAGKPGSFAAALFSSRDSGRFVDRNPTGFVAASRREKTVEAAASPRSQSGSLDGLRQPQRPLAQFVNASQAGTGFEDGATRRIKIRSLPIIGNPGNDRSSQGTASPSDHRYHPGFGLLLGDLEDPQATPPRIPFVLALITRRPNRVLTRAASASARQHENDCKAIQQILDGESQKKHKPGWWVHSG